MKLNTTVNNKTFKNSSNTSSWTTNFIKPITNASVSVEKNKKNAAVKTAVNTKKTVKTTNIKIKNDSNKEDNEHITEKTNINTNKTVKTTNIKNDTNKTVKTTNIKNDTIKEDNEHITEKTNITNNIKKMLNISELKNDAKLALTRIINCSSVIYDMRNIQKLMVNEQRFFNFNTHINNINNIQHMKLILNNQTIPNIDYIYLNDNLRYHHIIYNYIYDVLYKTNIVTNDKLYDITCNFLLIYIYTKHYSNNYNDDVININYKYYIDYLIQNDNMSNCVNEYYFNTLVSNLKDIINKYDNINSVISETILEANACDNTLEIYNEINSKIFIDTYTIYKSADDIYITAYKKNNDTSLKIVIGTKNTIEPIILDPIINHNIFNMNRKEKTLGNLYNIDFVNKNVGYCDFNDKLTLEQYMNKINSCYLEKGSKNIENACITTIKCIIAALNSIEFLLPFHSNKLKSVKDNIHTIEFIRLINTLDLDDTVDDNINNLIDFIEEDNYKNINITEFAVLKMSFVLIDIILEYYINSYESIINHDVESNYTGNNVKTTNKLYNLSYDALSNLKISKLISIISNTYNFNDAIKINYIEKFITSASIIIFNKQINKNMQLKEFISFNKENNNTLINEIKDLYYNRNKLIHISF